MNAATSLLLWLFLLNSPCSLRPMSNLFPPIPINVVLTVRTTHSNHATRLKHIVETWAKPEDRPKWTQIFIVSDSPSTSPLLKVLNSCCPVGHHSKALCCKLAFEMRLALSHQSADFWCHFDDDSFVILPNLHWKLQQFSSNSDLYLGRASTSGPISFVTTRNNDEKANDPVLSRKFWFGTGGAGICLSRSTLLKMQAFIMGNHFETICAQLGLPDDVTLGFVLSNLLGVNLTNSVQFHSHLERLDRIPSSELVQQISLSASAEGGNFVDIPGNFSSYPLERDPMRFHLLQKFIRRLRRTFSQQYFD